MNALTAAGFTMTYGTSMYGLKQRGKLKTGEKLLVLGAGGGVGIDMNSVNPDTMANIKIKFEGCDAPEGVMRINDQLVKTISGTSEDKETK